MRASLLFSKMKMEGKMKKLLTSMIAAALFLGVSSPSKADYFDWSSSKVVSIEDSANDIISTDLSAGDITRVSYGSDDLFHYFRMDLQSGPSHEFLYEVHVNLDENVLFGYDYLIDGTTDGQYYLFGTNDFLSVDGQAGNSFLEWRIDRNLLSSVFNFRGSTMTYDPSNVYDSFDVDITSVAATPTPIPGAVWLLGSGLAGLIALRRKNRL